MPTYKTTGVCSVLINYEVEDGKLKDLQFIKGCPGNAIGIASLVKGMEIEEVIKRLKGITCGGKTTSCPDQLAKALEQHLAQIN